MAEKIAESVWKAFTKKQKVELDDKELLKALARFDKTDEHKPEQRLEALKDLAKEIPKQVAALAKRKKELGDKPFGALKDELYAMLEEAEALEKKAQAALDAEDDEDEDSVPSALVNPKLLLKQLQMCRKDPDRTMKFAFVDAKDKQPAMLAMHPRMSARALFGKLQAAAGVKTGAYGSAWVDGMSLMLQLDKPLSGLVKKVRPPVKACGFRITKAVLWNEDGTVFEQDEEGAGEGPQNAGDSEASAPTSATAPPQPSATYEAKLAALQPRVKQAADAGSPDVGKHQRLMEFAAGKAEAKDFLGALAALKQLEQLLDNPTPKTTSGGSNVDAGVAFKARMAALIPKIKEAQAAAHPGAQNGKLKASEAGVLASKGDFEGAHLLLDEAEESLHSTAAPQAQDRNPRGAPEGGAPVGRVAVEVLRNELRTLRAQAVGGMTQLVTVLNADPHPQAAAIARVVTQLTQQMPSEMEDALLQMDEAMRNNDAAAMATHRTAVRKGATDWLAFLQANQEPIRGCEANPWGIPIQIDKPFRASLRAILKTAQ